MEWHKTSAGQLCRMCNFQLTDLKSYKAHLKLHERARMYQCVICGVNNKSSSRLKSHVNTHVNDENPCNFVLRSST